MKLKLNYLVIPLAVFITALLGSYFTSQGVDDWYKELTKPHWTPPGSFIGIMWTFIYVLVTLIVLSFYNKFRGEKNFKIIISVFVLNAILNATWSLLFFTLNLLLLSFIQIVLLFITIILLMILIWPKSRLLSLALLPYACWVIVAGTLNYLIFILN